MRHFGEVVIQEVVKKYCLNFDRMFVSRMIEHVMCKITRFRRKKERKEKHFLDRILLNIRFFRK